MRAQLRMANKPNRNVCLLGRRGINRGGRPLLPCVFMIEVLPHFATSVSQSRSGGSSIPPLGFVAGLISRWPGVKLLITRARYDKTPARLDRRVVGRGISALAVTACLALTASASPAAAAYWYGGWYGGWHKHKSAHKSHEPKAADRAGKEPAADIPKGPQQIFISINQQKLYFYSDGVHVADTSIATGVAAHPTPFGVFSIIQKQIFHRSNIYSNAPMPYMQRITWSGVAMHEGQNIGHPASHGCIRMPHDFAVRLYHLTKLNTRVIIARAELKPVEFADPHLFVHKERPPEIAAPVANDLEPVVAKPAELAVHANTLTPPVQSDALTPQAAAPVVQPDQKPDSAAPGANASAVAAVAPAAPPTPTDLARVAAAKKNPISIFVSRKRQRLYIRQDFEPLFDVPVTITEPESPLGTHVFTALEFTGPEHTILRWNVVSLPGEPPKRVRYVEEHRDRHGRVRRREIEEDRAGDVPAPQTPSQVLARIEIAPEVSDAIAQMIVPGSALIVSDQGLGDETGEGTDFDVVTR
jgi:lipoprotein-anchoring transpeptidase ErfK/SrfK